MPKILELARPTRALDGVLIKRADLRDALCAARLIADAKRRAKRLLQQAQQQADDYRRQGYLQGYGDGVLAGAEAQVAALGDAWRLYRTHADSLQTELRALLAHLLSQPAMALTLMDEWLARRVPGDAPCVEVRLPRAWHQARAGFEQRTAALPGARVSLHDASHFVIKSGDHLYEFAPDAAVGTLERQILQAARQQDWPAACAEIATAALARLGLEPARAGLHLNQE